MSVYIFIFVKGKSLIVMTNTQPDNDETSLNKISLLLF